MVGQKKDESETVGGRQKVSDSMAAAGTGYGLLTYTLSIPSCHYQLSHLLLATVSQEMRARCVFAQKS
jgi:hypothetical protein